MAYEIKIIGEQTPVVLSNDDGLKVIALFEDKKVDRDAKINLGDVIRTKKGQIRSIRKVEDSATANKRVSAVAEEVDKVHREIYFSWVKKTPEEKAERLDLFIEGYRAIYDVPPPPEVLEALKKDLVVFFRLNPKRTYADPGIYIEHFGDARKKVISSFKFVIFRVMEKVIANDMIISKNIWK